MYLLANRDLELSCDEAVVQEYGRDARASYALTLVGLEEHRTVLAPLESSFSRNDLTGRVTSILRSHQITAVSVGCALILVAVVAGAFATNPPERTKIRRVLQACKTPAQCRKPIPAK